MQIDDDCLLATVLVFALIGNLDQAGSVSAYHTYYIPWGWVGQTMFIFEHKLDLQ